MKKVLVCLAALAVVSATNLNLNEICRGILFATVPHPTDQNLFIGCIKGKGTVLGCDEGEVFDQFSVKCVSNFLPPPPSYEELCRNVTFGWFPYEDNCELYVVCEFGETRIRQCPDNSIFLPTLPGCVPGSSETCIYDHDTTSEMPTEVPTTPPTTPAPTEVPTTLPTTPAPTEVPSTPPTTESTEGSSTPATPRTTTPRTTTPRNPNDVTISFVCPSDHKEGHLVPNASNCSRYFECIQTIRWPRECESGQVFDVITSRCGDPETSLCASNIRCI